jgi:hypothetical protein
VRAAAVMVVSPKMIASIQSSSGTLVSMPFPSADSSAAV